MGWQNNIFPLLIITSSGNFTGLFVYSTSPPSAGHLIASIAATGGTDPYGNAYKVGIDSYGSSTSVFTQLTGGQIQFGDTGNVLPGQLSHAIRLLEMFPSASALTDLLPALEMIATAAGGHPQVLIGSFTASGVPPSASTNALLEVQGDVQAGNGLSVGQGAAVQTLVNGATISTAGITMKPVTCAASVTGIIMQPGTFDGQVMAVPSNAGAGVTITFAASGTSNVSVGVSGVIQPGSTGLFFWVSSLALWFPVVSV